MFGLYVLIISFLCLAVLVFGTGYLAMRAISEAIQSL
jgi:hypothetical protein